MKILSFDVGGTKIAYALVNARGQIISEITTHPTPKECKKIEHIFKQAALQHKADGLAVATAGVVFENRLLAKPLNLPAGYEKIDFNALTGLPFLLENDANAAIWAEHKIGSLKKTRYAVMLTLGTGVGCGIIVDGQLLRGKTGAAGEVRYPLAGADLAKAAQKYGLSEADCFKIYEQMQLGNFAARRAYEEWQKNLIESIIEINRLLDVEAVALAGSLAKIANYQHIEEAVNLRSYRNPLRIIPAKCDQAAGLIGAALLFKEKQND